MLQNNGSNNLPVSGNGAFTFPTSIASGGTYDVAVLTQPSGPVQDCVTAYGSGTASAVVTSVQINCFGAWTWVSGSNMASLIANTHCACMGVPGTQGIYGTQGTAAPGNVPGARVSAVSWTDAAGNFWLFGGEGFDSTAAYYFLNDLWKYSAGEWTWVSGSNVVDQRGVYGTQGVAAPGNVPGARNAAVSWTDAAGNLWLFGGEGYDSTGTLAYLNDLWMFSAGEWTWMSGSNVAGSQGNASGQSGVYGTQGIAAPGNVPGARLNAVSWTDAAGNLWLFGGAGQDSIAGSYEEWLNDLWKFSAGEWTWVSGSNVAGQPGVYGMQGVAAPGNVPGGRFAAVSWTDPAGNLWLFGGYGVDSGGTILDHNDLWKFSAGEWTWVSGSNVAAQPGVYGMQGVAAPGNVPGARQNAVGWADSAGNLWLFGGGGYDSSGTDITLNDLWKFSAGEWTWVSGSNVVNEPVTYGVPGSYGVQGIAAASNAPGTRASATAATDPAGNFWLFGGAGLDSTGTGGRLNDLWKFQP